LGGAVAASAALPFSLAGHEPAQRSSAESLSDLGAQLRGRDSADEAYWRFVRDQFPIRKDLVLMNAANLCPSPYPVQQRVFELTRDVDGDASFQNRGKFGELAQESREALARLMGCDTSEVAIVRNTSSANATAVNGLNLGPGDEVVLWDQNHPTNNVAWDVRAERMGFTVKRVTTPQASGNADELLAVFSDALSANTSVLSFSHVSNVTGVALPAKALCRMAHDRGALAMVDGAQSFGALRVDLHDMGCDLYSGSAHKWLIGPKEAGILFVKQDLHEYMWATHVGVGWSSAVANGARKFEVLGQRDDAAVAAVATTVEFHETIGPDQVDARVRELATALKSGLSEGVPGIRFHTPVSSEESAGVVVFSLPGVENHGPIFSRLYEEFGVAGAPQGSVNGFRLCPHIYNTLEQVAHAVEAVTRVAP
jgi:selenocysteine lyase/cysteine desulfurase